MEMVYLNGILLNEMQVQFFLSIGYKLIFLGVINNVWIYEFEDEEVIKSE